MPAADDYRIKAADMNARARREPNMLTRSEYENLALAYLRLAEQAKKNEASDIVYETPREQRRPQAQQQQQLQPEKK